MSYYTDRKFISLLSYRLDRFTQKNEKLWNFRCPICGDSKKSKIKARAYLFENRNHISFKCHNCHASMSLANLIKTVDAPLYRQYQLESYQDSNGGNVKRPDIFEEFNKKPVFNTNPIKLPSVLSLPADHIARKEVMRRKIPSIWWGDLYYTEEFKDFVFKVFPREHHDKLTNDGPRLVIPFYDQANNLIGLQGRALFNTSLRYLTAKAAPEASKVFGLNKVNLKSPIYVLEGPIDAMMLPNALAALDSSLIHVKKEVGEYDYVFVFDNEPRNREVMKSMRRVVEMGEKVVIWPAGIDQKDVNDMVMAGIDPMQIIEKNIYQGLQAKLAFEMWSKT